MTPAPSAPRQQEQAVPGDAAECARAAEPLPPFAAPDEVKASRQSRDWAKAFAVCKAASDAEPTPERLRFLLGEAALHQKDYLNAQRLLNLAAEAGDSDAEAELGAMYATGKGVVKNYSRALDAFAKAAAADNARAVTDLASMYANGWGVAKDESKALALYKKGVELGDPFALGQTGVMYFGGKGVPRDYAAAEQYFQQAADLHDGYSMKYLAVLYEHGLVGPPDAERAAQLRLRAAEDDPDSPTPEVTFPKVSPPIAGHAVTRRRIVHYVWRVHRFGSPFYLPATGCCPRSALICPMGRVWCS